MPADVHAQGAAVGKQWPRAHGGRQAPSCRQRCRGVTVPEDGKRRWCPVGARSTPRPVQPVDPVVPTDLRGQRPTNHYLAGKLNRVGRRLCRLGDMDDDVAHRPRSAIGELLPGSGRKFTQQRAEPGVFHGRNLHGLSVLDSRDRCYISICHRGFLLFVICWRCSTSARNIRTTRSARRTQSWPPGSLATCRWASPLTNAENWSRSGCVATATV